MKVWCDSDRRRQGAHCRADGPVFPTAWRKEIADVCKAPEELLKRRSCKGRPGLKQEGP